VLQRDAGVTLTALGEAVGDAYGAIHSAAGESLAGLRTIKALSIETQASDRIATAQQRLRNAEEDFWRLHGAGQVALQGGGAVVLALGIWIAVARFGAGPAQLVPLAAVFVRSIPLVGGLHDALLQWTHARPALDAVQALIQRFARNREPASAQSVAPMPCAAIVLRDVTVRYAGGSEPVLSQVSLALPVGSITAIEGPSGAGKSTLADVLAGLIEPDAGALEIDGEHLDPAGRRGWRRRVGHVAQDPMLFTGTIRDNLLLAAPQADNVRLATALREAAADYAEALPDGLDCRIGDGGRTLSGGEVQRLLLARALLQDPALLILDEATNALDAANEALVADALERLRGTKTIVIIAHHGALTALADRTFRLEQGRIVAGE
jgi:ATP-binding cassette subfamily C protein